MSNYVFVYGTLKSGNAIRGLHQFPGAEFVGKATTINPQYSLIDLGAFPAVLKSGTNYISGEVWAVDNATMEKLDLYEGYPDFYKRELVETDKGVAWMYFLESFYENEAKDTTAIKNTNNILEWNK